MATPVSDARGTRIVIGLVPALYDEVDIAYPSETVTVYTFKLDSVVAGIVQLTNDSEGQLVNARRIG